MSGSSGSADSGRFSGHRHSFRVPEKSASSSFSQTCSLLSQYLKENKGTFGDLSLGIPTATTTMNLFPVAMKSSEVSRNGTPVTRNLTSMDLFPQQSGFGSNISMEESLNKVDSSVINKSEPETAQMTIFYARATQFVSSTAIVVFALLGLLAAIIQSIADPFRTHPKTIQVFVMSICSYSLVLVLKELFELQGQRIIGDNYARLFCHATLIIGALSPVSLVSVLVSERIIWLPYVIWSLCSVIVLRLEAWDMFTGFLAPWIAGPGNGN